MAKYFLFVDGMPKPLEDVVIDKAKQSALEEAKEQGACVELWEQTPDRGAVNVNFR